MTCFSVGQQALPTVALEGEREQKGKKMTHESKTETVLPSTPSHNTAKATTVPHALYCARKYQSINKYIYNNIILLYYKMYSSSVYWLYIHIRYEPYATSHAHSRTVRVVQDGKSTVH